MKVIEGAVDKYGQDCMIFSTTDLRKITEWLWKHYAGDAYKFGIILDVPDEWEDPPRETFVYFLDTIAEEVAYYSNIKICDGCRRNSSKTP